MMKSKKNLCWPALVLLALALTGCPNSATVQPEGGNTPSNTGETKTEKVEAVSTSGTMGKPEAKADGSTTLTTTDSTDGRYTFTQPSAAAASIRSSSSSSGGTWDYTNRRGIKQFAGSYSGDITSSGAGSLSLTVEKAADPSGKLQEVTAPQNFEFKVTDTGTFTATIPAVEIVVQQQPVATAKLIKTVTMTASYDYTNATESQTIPLHLYSDNTFKIGLDSTSTYKGVNFSSKITGIAYTGTYTGNPSKDGEIILNIQKMNTFLRGNEQQAMFQAYKEGKTSVTFEVTEESLRPTQSTQLAVISGSTFQVLGTGIATYTQNADDSTTFQVNVAGTDAHKFQLQYRTYTGEYLTSSDTNQTGSFATPISIANATDDTKVEITLFQRDDTTTDDTSLRQRFRLKPGYNAQIDMNIRKISVPFALEGNPDQYENIYVRTDFGSIASSVPASSGVIDFYFLDGNDITFKLYAENWTSSSARYGHSISDSVQVILDKENPPTTPVTIKLYDKLTEGNKITIAEYPSDTTFKEEQKKHFRFVKETGGNITFYIPVGTGTDGEFITCSSSCNRGSSGSTQCYSNNIQHLLEATYYPFDNTQAYNNHQYQFTGLLQNMQDVVDFLEKRMKLTVEGKELIGLQ